MAIASTEPKRDRAAPSAEQLEDRQLLDRIGGHAALLADLTHADVSLYARRGDAIVRLAQAQPVPVPSLYADGQPLRRVSREEVPQAYRILADGHHRSLVNGTVIRGAPVVQEAFPVFSSRGQIVGVVLSEMALIEHERQRKRHSAFRRAIARARELIITGRMRGGEGIGRLGVHDGVMIIDSTGRIVYLSAPVEHLYRRLGYADNLVKTQLQELETNEYICFKAMERGSCMEQRIQEHDLTWIKRVIPLPPVASDGWAGWLTGHTSQPGGAIVAIEDVTDELQKEQELKIKAAMIQEIHHRVKNNLQTIAALLRLQARRSDDPRVTEMLRETIGRILSIAVVHEFLSQEETTAINIHEVCNRILSEVRNGVLDSSSTVNLVLEGSRTFTLPAQQATSCALIVNELVQNAVEHAFADRGAGTIRVRLGERDDSMFIEIEDDGQGFTQEAESTRRSGLGLQIVQTLVREDLKGGFDLQSGPGGGVKAVVSFPKWVARGK